MKTVSQILAPRLSDAIFVDLLAKAEAKGLTARGWQAQQIAWALTSIQSDTSESWESLRVDIVNGGFLGSATGAWLDLVAAGSYQELRTPPTTTVVQLQLADTVNGGPYVLSPGQIAVATGAGGEALFYRSSQTIQIPCGGSVAMPFAAESPGAKYNVSPTQITSLRTPVPGIAVTSPPMSTGAIILSTGADAESDDALTLRCQQKWAILGRGWSVDTIKFLIQQFDPGITRMLVRDPGDLPYAAEAYLADVTGPVSAARVLAVYNYLIGRSIKPGGNYPVLCRQSTLMTSYRTVTLYSNGTNPNVQADANARLLAYMATTQIGEEIYGSRLNHEFVDPDAGVIACSQSPFADIVPAFSDAVIVVPTYIVVQV